MYLPISNEIGIRSLRPSDETALVLHANDKAVANNLLDRFPHPYTLADARDWIAGAQQERPETSFAICERDALIGGIGLMGQSDVYRRTAELGYWLARRFWGRGIGSRVVAAFTPWAFRNFELDRIEACVFSGNEASCRVLKKAGYQLDGRMRDKVYKFGVRRDLLIYSRLASDA
jgi:ribosomal-protein-alanine N-acetyltransferase